jgi:LCP family protein required for cell wall assembly
MHHVFWSAAFLATAGTSAVLGFAAALTLPFPGSATSQEHQNFSIVDLWQRGFRYRVTRPVNILVMGIDRVPGTSPTSEDIFTGRSDTMLLVRIDPEHEGINVLSIPRDTQVEVPGLGVTKINHANPIGGPRLASDVVSGTLNGVTIDRYVRVSTDAFKELVDLLGGVKVFVPEPMDYEDQTQGLSIHLDQGWQTLNGDEAEQFARFRNDGFGDIGRVQRQQQLLSALRDRLTSPSVIPKIPQVIELLQQYIDTNLTLEEMLALVDTGLAMGSDDLRMVMLPGRFSAPEEFIASYWIMDTDGRDRVMAQYFGMDSATPVTSARTMRSLRIAVQNASGDPQVATNMANYLYGQGFYNVYVVQDWPDQQAQTQIIVQQGDLQSAGQVEAILGVGHVVSASVGELESDLTIRVGHDWMEHLQGDRIDS